MGLDNLARISMGAVTLSIAWVVVIATIAVLGRRR